MLYLARCHPHPLQHTSSKVFRILLASYQRHTIPHPGGNSHRQRQELSIQTHLGALAEIDQPVIDQLMKLCSVTLHLRQYRLPLVHRFSLGGG